MLQPTISERDNTSGSQNALITLVEYGDYQCPHCGHAYPIIKNIQETLGNDLRFVFRNFPLQEIHPNAFEAALATEAAARQNAFWEMHDIIFENQHLINQVILLSYADQLGLDTIQFANDMNDEELIEKVENDFESGIISGVNGTPTFFINGKRYNGSWEGTDLLNVLNSLL